VPDPEALLLPHIQPLAGGVVRITDRQGYRASERWTETLAEQARLEALIETVKPPLPAGVAQHRLLITPFRYPPLRCGSRFTPPDQREMFYGARSLATVLAERAFHALRLLEGAPLPPGKAIHRQQTSFHVDIQVQRGLQLQHCLEESALQAVTDPCSYAASQRLGREMRQLGVEAFEVPSARAPQEAPCVGVLSVMAFSSTPFDFQDWTLEIRPEGVTFASFGLSQVITLKREQFLVKGRWPGPDPG
jgi:hypothetical protein